MMDMAISQEIIPKVDEPGYAPELSAALSKASSVSLLTSGGSVASTELATSLQERVDPSNNRWGAFESLHEGIGRIVEIQR